LIELIKKVTGLLTLAERGRVLIMIVLMLIGMLLEMFGIGMVIPLMSIFIQNDLKTTYPQFEPLLNWLGNPNQLELLTMALGFIFVVYLIKALFLGASLWWQMRFVYGVQASLSGRIFNSYLNQPYSFHLNKNTSELLRNAIMEVIEFNTKVLVPGTQLIGESLVSFGIVVLLFIIEPVGALVTFSIVISMAWAFYWIIREPITRWGMERQHHEGLRIQHLQQGLGAIKDVKLLAREQEFFGQFDIHNQITAAMNRKRATVVELPRLWLEVLAVGGLATLVVVMVQQNRGPEEIISFLGLFGIAVFRLIPSANRMLNSIQSLRFGLPVVEILHKELHSGENEVIAVKKEMVKSEKEEQSLHFNDNISIEKLCFSYSKDTPEVLNNLSFKISRNDAIGIIGESGSGKSTVVDLILGLLLPTKGNIYVDGVDIKSDLRSWQRSIGYVPQSIYLTDDTLRKNIAFGLPDDEIDDAAVDRAASAAQLSLFINGLNEGLDTFVGERGVRLSGGQRQRIGIARALYFDPEVIVLDEATSALDTETEEGVMHAVEKLKGEKTLIIVAHRVSTLKGCNKVIQLDKGRLVKECTFDELEIT
tara:strand:- start:866 stop:2641 length:1776 start_codon:yes stop_codon:yes gene_type:complete